MLKYDIANELQLNIKDESEAITSYTHFLNMIDDVIAEKTLKGEDTTEYQALKDMISEIVSDELNHIELLSLAYYKFTGIEPKDD